VLVKRLLVLERQLLLLDLNLDLVLLRLLLLHHLLLDLGLRGEL
jgi:hypothetical protein